jgi:hypothetical protein
MSFTGCMIDTHLGSVDSSARNKKNCQKLAAATMGVSDGIAGIHFCGRFSGVLG